eukprot:scaffold175562_cov38-Prasinocladus_malaysianus.AAC.1
MAVKGEVSHQPNRRCRNWNGSSVAESARLNNSENMTLCAAKLCSGPRDGVGMSGSWEEAREAAALALAALMLAAGPSLANELAAQGAAEAIAAAAAETRWHSSVGN